jgi:hypothetical protein
MTMWYIQRDGQPIGPVDAEGAKKLCQAGGLGHATLVCRVGDQAWSRASSDDELIRLLEPWLRAAPPIGSMAPPPSVAGINNWDVRKTATAHRTMLLLLLASMPVTVLNFATLESSPTNLIVALVSLSISVGMIVFTCKALSAMRTNVGLIILTAILLLAPCINFFTLVVLSQVIQRKLKTVGLTCGFLGVSKSDLSAAGF